MVATVHNEPKFSQMFVSYLLTRNSLRHRRNEADAFLYAGCLPENPLSILPLSIARCRGHLLVRDISMTSCRYNAIMLSGHTNSGMVLQ